MLTALILVCSLASAPDLGACTEDTALTVVRDPETFTSSITCLMHGQAYLAETAIELIGCLRGLRTSWLNA